MRYNKYADTITPMRLLQTIIAMGPDEPRAQAILLVGLVMDMEMPGGYDPIRVLGALAVVETAIVGMVDTNKDAYDSLTWVINTLRAEASAVE